MSILTVDHLRNTIGMPEGRANKLIVPLNSAMEEFGIDTPKRVAGFISQSAHESAAFSRLSENLNYSSEALLRVFSRYFTQQEALEFAHKPGDIASRVYQNRMGNGDYKTRDGWKFRGRGVIQITGRDNYQLCGAALGVDLIENPDRLLEIDLACRSGAWYWDSRKLNDLADEGDVVAMTRRINGGLNGLKDRTEIYSKLMRVLTV
jgi:putative chitinase